MVRAVGLEPTRLSVLEPKSSASTNFATLASLSPLFQTHLEMPAIAGRRVCVTSLLLKSSLLQSSVGFPLSRLQSAGFSLVSLHYFRVLRFTRPPELCGVQLSRYARRAVLWLVVKERGAAVLLLRRLMWQY